MMLICNNILFKFKVFIHHCSVCCTAYNLCYPNKKILYYSNENENHTENK